MLGKCRALRAGESPTDYGVCGKSPTCCVHCPSMYTNSGKCIDVHLSEALAAVVDWPDSNPRRSKWNDQLAHRYRAASHSSRHGLQRHWEGAREGRGGGASYGIQLREMAASGLRRQDRPPTPCTGPRYHSLFRIE